MANLQLLNEKREEIERELQAWAIKNRMLAPGEKLKVLVGIERVPVAAGTATVNDGRIPPKCGRVWYQNRERNIGEDDWQRIFSLPWLDWQQAVLKTIKIGENKPLSRDELKNAVRNLYGGSFLATNENTTINKRFRKAKLPYRILHCADRERWQLCIVK